MGFGSSLLTPEVIRGVIEEVLPLAMTAANALGDPSKKDKPFYVVVAFKNGKCYGATFNDSVVYQCGYNFGDNSFGPYDIVATGKTKLSWAYEEYSHRVVVELPHLGESGDPKYQGGVHYRGISCGTSGREAAIDEMISMWIATALVAKAQLLVKALSESEERCFK